MILIAAATALAAHAFPPPRHGGGVAIQARAVVRIVHGARLHLPHPPNDHSAMVRQTRIRVDGGERPAQLIEFE
jgi:hypothetical protein